MPAQVRLHLKDHCIETAAKKELKRLMDIYFEDDVKSTAEIEENIDILEKFLNASDFPSLRASDNRLSGDVESVVYIHKDENDNINLDFGRTF